MHQFTINAGIQLVPISSQKHPYEWVDMVIDIIKESGLSYEVGAFNTSVEGSYEQVRLLVDRINDFLVQEQCPEWLLNVQYQLRGDRSMSMGEKTEKFR